MKYLLPLFMFCSGCTTTATGRRNLLGLIPLPFTGGGSDPKDPYAIWQEYAIYIVIGGIVIGVADFMMDRKLTLIGPGIAVCGLVVSIWGITLPIIATILPWALGVSVAFWVYSRYFKRIGK